MRGLTGSRVRARAVNCVMVDGPATSVAESIAPNVYAAKGTRARRD